jgi:K+-sensing histidine kinase KdpD
MKIRKHKVYNKKNDQSKKESIAEFVSVVSHDLKNPLASIKAYSQLAKKILLEKDDKKTAQLVEKIDKQADRATKLISELLDIQRLSNQDIQLSKKLFSIDRLVKETVYEYQQTISTHTIKVDVKTKTKVMADKERIRRVLLNLLTNAVKYSPNASSVIVLAKKDKKNVTICIQDFGVGIPVAKHKFLFDQYFRVKEDDMQQAQGYGLGLPIVKKIVEAHNGKVWFKSQKDKGSIFFFSLPLDS